MMIAGLAWIVLLLLTLGLAGNAVWRAVMPPPGTPREAGCGSCGYELTTLEHGRCSECGADLLKAGIATRRNLVRISGSLAAGIMGWTILAGFAGTIVLYTISMIAVMSSSGAFAGSGSMYDSDFAFGVPQTYDNDAGEFVRDIDFDMTVEVDVMGDWSGPANSGTIVVLLEHDGQEAELRFDDASTTDWLLFDPAGDEIGSGTSFTATNALVCLESIGLDASADPAIAEIASETERIIDAALNNPFDYESDIDMSDPPALKKLEQTGGSSYNNVATPFASTTPADWIIPLATVGLTFLIWLAGLIWMIRRRGRLIEGPRPVATL